MTVAPVRRANAGEVVAAQAAVLRAFGLGSGTPHGVWPHTSVGELGAEPSGVAAALRRDLGVVLAPADLHPERSLGDLIAALAAARA